MLKNMSHFHVEILNEISEDVLIFLNRFFRYQNSIQEMEHFSFGGSENTNRLYAVKNDGAISAIYGVLDNKVFIDNAAYNFGLANYMAIDPIVRSPRFFADLSNAVFECEARLGTKAIFGPPNRDGYLAHKALAGWSDLVTLSTLVVSGRGVDCNDPNFKMGGEFSDAHVALACSVLQAFRFSMARSLNWYKWRYTDFPRRDYQIASYYTGAELAAFAVLKEWRAEDGGQTCHIMEIHAKNVDVEEALIASIVASRSSEWNINVWCHDKDPSFVLYQSLGFRVASQQPIIFRSLDKKLQMPVGEATRFFFGDADGY